MLCSITIEERYLIPLIQKEMLPFLLIRYILFYILLQTVSGTHWRIPSIISTNSTNPTLIPSYHSHFFFNAWMFGIDWTEQIIEFVSKFRSISNSGCGLEQESRYENGAEVQDLEGERAGSRSVRLQFTPLPYFDDAHDNKQEQLISQPYSTVSGWFDPRVYGGRMLDVRFSYA